MNVDKRVLIKNIGNFVRDKRMESMLHMKTVSRRTGIAMSALSQLENGINSPVTWNFLRILKAIGVDNVDVTEIENYHRRKVVDLGD